ncbi:MAG: ERF family protein [Peptostreptococcus porci]|nr:ERF family protein [Peptostreptococcus porci]
MSIYATLTEIQNELKAPKNQYNRFGKYKYRSCEDILEALKPLLLKHKATLIINDEIQEMGTRIYVKAICTFVVGDEKIQTTAFAREEESKKGMDGSQVTGASSSYARKYALNGLFLIDDTKDADTDEFKEQSKNKQENKSKQELTKEQINILYSMASEKGFTQKDIQSVISKSFNKRSVTELSQTEYNEILDRMEKSTSKKGKKDQEQTAMEI